MCPGKGFPGSQTGARARSPGLGNRREVATGLSQETLEEKAGDLGEVGVAPEMSSLSCGWQHAGELREGTGSFPAPLACSGRWLMWVHEGGHRLGKMSPDTASEPMRYGLPASRQAVV